MPLPKATYLAAGAALGLVASGLSTASSQVSKLGTLSSNEGILVDVKNFNITRGKSKAAEPSAMLVKTGARQVNDGAVIFRSGEKLYIIDGDPRSGAQAMNPGDPLPTTIDGFNNLFENF